MLALDEVYCMDYVEFFNQIPDDSVDLILTDPPYAKKFLYLYTGLAANGVRVLKDGHNLLTMVGNFLIPEVMATMGMFLKYRWTICQPYFSGSHARLLMGIRVGWKPVLWYVKNKHWPNRPLCDVLSGGKADKSLHLWQQDLEWAVELIEGLTDEGDLVVDPFIGSGTVGVAAEMLGRRWLGCDIDEKAVEITKKRIQELRAAQ